MDIAEIKGWIKRKLGDGWVEVELTPEQLTDCIEDALLWWASRKGWYSEGALNLVSGTVAYNLSAIDPPVLDVIQVWFTENPVTNFSWAYGGFFDMDGFPYGDYPFRGQMGGGNYFSLVQWMQTHEMGSRILSVDSDFIYRKQTKELIITPEPRRNGTIIYQYSTPFKSDYLDLIELEHQYLIRRYALAEAMETLGRIRSKYSSLPAADGDVSLDGGDLLSASVDTKMKLDEELGSYLEPTPILIG